ncbi:MAG: insulinase family protein [Opitutaceae bacterium]
MAFKRSLFLLGALFASAAFAVPAPPFPQEKSDLKPDPAASFGALTNGVRYVILPNLEPKDRASLRLLVLSGSLEETEGQRGLAHYLEHMAFNGSTHHPPGTLVEYFQRLGMSFGGDTNAYTSFDRTVFKIELPDVKPATVAEGLGVFSDMAGGLLLRPDMVAKERPIILSEKRTRDSADYRQFVASFRFLLPDSLLSSRMPIGLEDVINRATRADFADLYDTWYRPERMVVIVVGQVDAAAVAKQIANAFGSVADRAPARPDPNLGLVTAALGVKAAYDPEPDAPATTVSIDVMAPYTYQVDTAAVRYRHLKRDLALAMLNRRLAILAKKEGAPFTRAEADVQESFQFFRDAGINITCAPEQWPAALGVGEQELRKALRFGFTAAELKEATANFTNDLKQAEAGAATRRSFDLADELVETLASRMVFTSPAEDLALFEPELAKVTPEDCADALRSSFAGPGRFVMVSGNAVIPGDAAAAISNAYKVADSKPVEPPAGQAEVAFAYTDFGAPGAVAERHPVDDLDLTLVRFANGVRVNLKKTPFEENRILIRIRAGAGRLTEPKDKPGLSFLTDLTFKAGGLGRHSTDDLQRILAGKTVDVGFSTSDDAFELSGSTNRDDLLLELQLLAAYLTDPGYRPEALRTAKKDIDEIYNEIAHTPEGPLQSRVPRLLAGGDPRFGLPDRSVLLSRTLEDVKAWVGPQLARGPLEIGIAGDIDLNATLDALARTFGALPKRAAKPDYAAERMVSFPAKPLSWDLAVQTEIPKAVVALYWPTADARDVHRTRRLSVLGRILDDRLRVKIREQMGDAYSPEAANDSSETFRDYGVMAAECVVAPDRAKDIAQSIREIAADLHANGVTPDELERARAPLLTALRESARTNPYWLGAVLGSCQEFPQRLDWARTRMTDVQAITKAEVDALAKLYLAPERAFQVIVKPEQDVQLAPKQEPAAAPATR